ncbi:kinase-like domain-containing protein [Mycena olivaceomarginata]|nr:kinase-like domain-containing protein [Mycena olivaceomarginata]
MTANSVNLESIADIRQTIKLIRNTVESIRKGRRPWSSRHWADTEEDLNALRSELTQLSTLKRMPVDYLPYIADQGVRCRSTVVEFHSKINPSRGFFRLGVSSEELAAFRRQLYLLHLEVTDLSRAAQSAQLSQTQSTSDACFDPGIVQAIMELLDKLFHNDKQAYNRFLAYRGASAQWLLDLLQTLLDYDSNLVTMNRRRLCKALIRLSGDSKLHPRCFTLMNLEQERLVAGGSFGDVLYRITWQSKDVLRRSLAEKHLFGGNSLTPISFHLLVCITSREEFVWCHRGCKTVKSGAFLKENICETEDLLSLILDVALGLEHLHVMGIIHGDLKGDNILVTPSFRACIADFGLASIISPMSRSQGGTIRYQAPELHQGGHNDQRSDIYGFACLVYELLTGAAPFPELFSDGAVIMAVLEGRRPSRVPSCSGTPSLDALWNLLQNCWEEKPENRPTASQIVGCLIGADIQAIKKPSITDWDDIYTSKFRRNFLGKQPLPSAIKFEQMLFGEGHSEDLPDDSESIVDFLLEDVSWSRNAAVSSVFSDAVDSVPEILPRRRYLQGVKKVVRDFVRIRNKDHMAACI